MTGEFLLKLCKGNVSRFLRHFSFESSAGFLYSKGIFKGGDCSFDSEVESSDEEYFLIHPAESKSNDITPMIPKSQEEYEELEHLMKKITEFNSSRR